MEISITPAAGRFVRRLIRMNGGRHESGVRLIVTPGGCAGLTALFNVEAAPLAGDAVIEREDGVRLFLPAGARELLEGATIDFVETPLSSGFVFRNAKTAGSCGSGAGRNAPGGGAVGIASIGRRP